MVFYSIAYFSIYSVTVYNNSGSYINQHLTKKYVKSMYKMIFCTIHILKIVVILFYFIEMESHSVT